ncbi:unnamed protein product [Blepharisma stoltei]|uniref:Uncharacterized protein n=1 Tax=Blepharisma stoltei TaxID=1481888 RepID=A0AAU9IWZ1_9CILI|nr:unnamed protein product [Blepharisma stoltei]
MEQNFFLKIKQFLSAISCHKAQQSMDIGNLSYSTHEESLQQKNLDKLKSDSPNGTVWDARNTQDDSKCNPKSPLGSDKGVNDNRFSYLNDHESVNPQNNSLIEEINQFLWDAVENNQHELCKTILDKKRFGNQIKSDYFIEKYHMSPLHRASHLGHLKVCEVLLDYGNFEDLHSIDAWKMTPLHLSCKYGFLLISQLFVRSGANINAIDGIGNSPMHYALKSKNQELIEWMLLRSPDLYIKNLEGEDAYSMMTEIEQEKDILTEQKTHKLKIQTFEEDQIDLMMSQANVQNFSKIKGNQKVQKVPAFSDEDSVEEEMIESTNVGPSDFEVISILGKGSFGEVYLVRKFDSDELFAMKVLSKNKILGQNLVRYAMTERNIMTYVHHPFIVRLRYAFQSSNKLFLILEYCSGGDLGSYIAKNKFIPENQAKIYICEILLALEELHRHDIIYRDLKPENVVLNADGHALLTDFGLSKEGVDDNCTSNSFCGSVAYLAPEMLNRAGHGKSVDWYLLGVLLYEMLCGIPPFFSHSRDQLFNNIRNAKLSFPVKISFEAKDLISKLLKRDPTQRLGSSFDADEIKSHPFFEGIDWNAVMEKQLKPPRPPEKPVIVKKITQPKESEIEIENSHLEGWTFISDFKLYNS